MPECLLTGNLGLLAAHFARERLSRSSGEVFCEIACDRDALDFRETVRAACGETPFAESRLKTIDGGALDKVAEVWIFRDTHHDRDEEADLTASIEHWAANGTPEINFVLTPFAGERVLRWSRLKRAPVDKAALARKALASGIGCRFFETAMTVSEVGRNREGFHYFPAMLADFKRQIEERCSSYFRRFPLRCVVPVGAALSVQRAPEAARLICDLAENTRPDGSAMQVGSPSAISIPEIFERVRSELAVTLISVEDGGQLNEVDQLLASRLAGFFDLPAARERTSDETRRLDVALLSPTTPTSSHSDTGMESTVIGSGPDSFRYFATGRGRPIVLLNALGQGLKYWSRLICDLTGRGYRVLIWEARGTHCPPRPFRIGDQVKDIEAVLDQERIERCPVIGWCTGAKIAAEFAARRPERVECLILLNSALKTTAGSAEDSPYERNFAPFCRLLSANPGMAGAVLMSLRAMLAEAPEEEIEKETDHLRASAKVLDLIPRDLRSEVLAPFRDAASLMNYVAQTLDFWSYDLAARAGAVSAPVLLIASERDRVASQQASRRAVGWFPRARCLEIPGANHYVLYEQPEMIGEIADEFIRSEMKPSSPLPVKSNPRTSSRFTLARNAI